MALNPYPLRAVQVGGAGGEEFVAPVNFWEWFESIYPPDHFQYNTQFYFATISAGPGLTNTGNLNIQVPLYAFSFRSYGFVTNSGQNVAFPYRIGIAHSSSNDWTFGQWASQVITGNGINVDYAFPYPREVAASTQLTVTVVNALDSLNSITVDAGLIGIEPRLRDRPVERVQR